MSSLGLVLGIVHARAGSVRIPGKNLRPLGGKPLICWVLEAALGSRCDRVIVSTDSDAIADVAKECGAEVPFSRPAELAEDVASELVTRHAVEFWEQSNDETVGVAVTLQPTTPFMRSDDIDGCLSVLERNPDLESAITVAEAHQRPEWMYRRSSSDAGQELLTRPIRGADGISQMLPSLLHPNGGAYATRRRLLLEDRLLVANTTGMHVMDRMRSVDIDEETDFLLAQSVAALLMRNDLQGDHHPNQACEPQSKAS